jgi:endoglucanase
MVVMSATLCRGADEGVSGGAPAEAAMVGVNESVAEFGGLGGVYNRAYTYPGPRQFDFCKAKGFLVVRLPFRWERLQPNLMQPLDAAELQRLDATVKLARDRGIRLLLDVHNYARYRDKLIGTPEVPNEAFGDFWKRLAEHYKNETAVFAYGLMNEPHDTGGRWPAAAQTAVDAIRTVDRSHTISVCGDGWSGAHSWKKINDTLILKDPANHLIYEAHQYFDRDSSGTYKQSYDDSGANPNLGVERLRPFAQWCKEHNARGFIGEFGVPDNDSRWLVVLDNFLAAMKENRMGGTYWSAGPWWGSYSQSVEPRDGKDRPQIEVLQWYAGLRQRPKDAKITYVAPPPVTKPPAPAVGKVNLSGPGKTIYDCGTAHEPYFYTNQGSEIRSEVIVDGARQARRIHYRHQGTIAWAGAGLFFGGLDCHGYAAFCLTVRAQKPCTLEVKAYPADDIRYLGRFHVDTTWQELVIPFDALKGPAGSFATAGKLRRLELQPDPDRDGSSIDLGKLEVLGRKGK